MGVKCGHLFVDLIKFGKYNKDAKKFVIYVDGENIRYRGMISSNLTTHNVEEAIALTSFEYLKNCVRKIELLLGKLSEDVIVYMDGKRVSNKTANRAVFKYDATLIREIFKGICAKHGYSVIDLRHGESELQMYLQRKKDMDLNVFLTNDTDMIPICYNHMPTISWTDDDINCAIDVNESGITNFNSSYRIVDSCLWINCGTKEIIAVGMDNVKQKLRFNVTVFRILIAACGTDFTESLLTESMVTSILQMSDSEVEFINNLTHNATTLDSCIHEVLCCFLLHALRFGATIKREGKKSKNDLNVSIDNMKKSVSMYIDYVTSGSMTSDEIPRQNMSVIMRKYLHAMKGEYDLNNLEKKALMKWSNEIKFEDAISNMRNHISPSRGFKRNVIDKDDCTLSKKPKIAINF